MRITLSLALSQLKKKRTRSSAAIVAIMLSTALLTCVCSFIVSANAMLVGLLGEDYGEYGGAYMVMLLIPTVLLGILIIIMSVVVISNVFRISASERTVQFGTLKCVGATKKQIIETIIYESLLLSLIGIPCGILLGVLFSYVGIGLVNVGFEHFNSLVYMMINEVILTIEFTFSWSIPVVTTIIVLAEVLISAYLPARKAAGISAMDCIRRVGMIDTSKEKEQLGWLVRRYADIETLLAYKNVKRNQRNSRASVLALSISIILFVTLGVLQDIAQRVEDIISPSMRQTVVVDYTSSYKKQINEETGREEILFTRPIDISLTEEITQKLKSYDDTDFLGMGIDLQSYFTRIPEKYLTPQMLEALEFESGQEEYELSVDIIVLDQMNYEAICEKAGAEPGEIVLLNHHRYNDNGDEGNVVPFTDELRSVTVEKGDGSIWEIAIGGTLRQGEIPEDLYGASMNELRLIVPQAPMRGFSWYSSPADKEGYMEYARSVLAEYFPEGETEEYMEAGLDTRVFETDDFSKVMNIAILIGTVLLESFVILLAIIGITNVISTISTNVQMRSREFAVLQSVGMTTEQIRKMLNVESVLCAGKALFYGLPIGLLIVLILNKCVRSMFVMEYCIPWKTIIISIAVVFIVIWSIIRITAHKLLNQNIIETIRTEKI